MRGLLDGGARDLSLAAQRAAASTLTATGLFSAFSVIGRLVIG